MADVVAGTPVPGNRPTPS